MKKTFILLISLAFFYSFQVQASDHALNFDGTAQQRVNLSPAISYTPEFTVMIWANVSEPWSKMYAWVGPGTNNYVTIELWYDGRLRHYSPIDGVVVSNGPPINDGNWHHIAVTKSAGMVSLYIDGVFDNSGPVAHTITPNTSTMGAGYFNSTLQGMCNGTLDDLSVWNIALTPAEISNYFANSPIGSETGVMALYNFNNPSIIPGGNNAAFTSLMDNSGNGHTGTLSLFPLIGPTGNWVEGMFYVPPVIPISSWAIIIAAFAILLFILIRYRKRALV